MKYKLVLLTIFAFSTMALLAIASLISSTTPVRAAASDPAKLYVIVQDGGGNRITNASVSLTIGPVVSPQWCNYAGKNGTWAGVKTIWNGLTEYWFYQGGSVLQICCNASSFTLSVSAPGYQSRTLGVNLAGYNGSYLDYYVTLSPTPPQTGTIQGYKVLMPGNANAAPAAGQTVRLDGGSATTANPYFFTSVPAGNHSVSVTVPSGYRAGYTLCYNNTGCHGNAPTSGSSVTVNVPAGGYADLWWHYTPLPDLVIRNTGGSTSPAINGPTSVVVGESATYQARTRNAGTGVAAASTTRAWTSGS